MPLPLVNLDDRTFEALVEDATRLIPRRAPEWTDHNRHDPGITLVELFAWLAEMQHYYLNQVTDEHRHKFLKLLDSVPRGATRASAPVTFAFKSAPPSAAPASAAQPLPTIVPQGTRLAADDLIFETVEPLLVTPARLVRVLTSREAGFQDNTDANEVEGLAFAAFGDEATVGTRLYLGFEQLYLFSWQDALGVERDRLLQTLARAPGLNWVAEATIRRTASRLVISDADHRLTLRLDPDVSRVTVTGDGEPRSDLLARREGDRSRVFAPPFPPDAAIGLTISLAEDETVARGTHGDEPEAIVPSAVIIWEYYDGTTWAPLGLAAELEPLLVAATGAAAADEPLCLQDRAALLNRVRQTRSFPRLPVAAREYLADRLGSAQTAGQLRDLLVDSELLRLTGDETLMLSCSGRFTFVAPSDWAPRIINPFPDDLYWLRATVRQAGFEQSPRIDSVLLNTVQAEQRETLGEVVAFSSTGQPGQVFTASSHLALKGINLAQVAADDEYWEDWQAVPDLAASGPDDRHVLITADPARRSVALRFGDGVHGRVPPAGTENVPQNVRLVSADQRFESRRLLGRGDGLPGQTFRLDRTPVVPDDLLIQVAERTVAGVLRWRDWETVPDLDASGPSDPNYVLDAQSGELRFGDGVHGDVPPAPPDAASKNVRALAFRAGGGARGNVGPDAIVRLLEPIGDVASLTTNNRRAAAGGADPEALDETEARARRELRVPFRAVTSEDFEFLARATPGLRVARAKAIPLFEPGLIGYPEIQAPTTVTVVVVPYSRSPKPVPSRGFLLTVCRHLDRHRLITTRLQIVGPEYVRVDVRATVSMAEGFRSETVNLEVRRALDRFLDPLLGGSEGGGWPFGRPVYRSEVYQLIESVAGVDCVDRLVLTAEGAGVTRDADGNIVIGPRSLVFPGSHRVEIVVPEAACRPTMERP